MFLKPIKTIIQRDIRLSFAESAESLTPLLFFLIILSIFPLALGSETKILSQAAPAILWIGVILSLLLSADSLFKADFESGILEQFVLSPYPLSVIMLGNSLAHCITLGLPLLILASFMSLLFGFTTEQTFVFASTLALGLPSLSLVASIGAALTIGLSRGGLLLIVIILPLMVPILILSTSAVLAVREGNPYSAEIFLLGAIFLLVLVSAPLAISAIVRATV